MSLLADIVALAQPPRDPIVELLRRFDPELVHVVFWRNRLDGAEASIPQPASQDDVPIASTCSGPGRRLVDIGEAPAALRTRPPRLDGVPQAVTAMHISSTLAFGSKSRLTSRSAIAG